MSEKIPIELKNSILKQLQEPVKPRKKIFSLQKFQYNFISLNNVINILDLSDYRTDLMYDFTIKKMEYFTYFSTFAFVVARKRSKIISFFGFMIALGIELSFFAYLNKKQSLYKEAMFGNTEMSQDIRILLNFYFPENKYSEIFENRILEYNNKFNN